MTLQPIEERHWAEILRIQAQAYTDIIPESLETLRSKWLLSPQLCRVCEEGGHTLAYLLAHAWRGDTPPKLYQLLSPGDAGDTLFLHDLAISDSARGRRLGQSMVQHLLDAAQSHGFRQVLLVAVQDSGGFWSRFGFEAVPGVQPGSSYGEGARLMRRSVCA